MADNFRFWFVFLAIVAAITFTGWHEPLRYRFMSRQEIALEEHPIVHPTPQECEYCSPVEHSCTIPLFQEEGDDIHCGVFIYCLLKHY